MQQISRLLCMGILAALTALDLKYRRFPASVLYGAGALAALYCAVCCREQLWQHCCGLLAGSCFLAVSKYSGEGLGYGDSGLLCVLGMYLGLQKFLALLLTAWSLTALAAMLLLIRYRYRKDVTLPMVPMILIGYLSVWAAELLGWWS